MARNVPYENSYEFGKKIARRAEWILYSSTIISIGISILGYLEQLPLLKDVLIGINIILVCLYFFSDNWSSRVFRKAETKRRLDWLDNAFGTNFSGKKSEGYFTNENLSPGLRKLSVNCFENCFHTQFIISKMLPGMIIKTVIITIIFLGSAYIGNREVIRLFFELALPAVLVQQLIKALYFSSQVEDVLGQFQSLFNDLQTTGFDNKTAEALRDIMTYETTLSWAGIPLSSKIFTENQQKLAAEWQTLKQTYNIS